MLNIPSYISDINIIQVITKYILHNYLIIEYIRVQHIITRQTYSS